MDSDRFIDILAFLSYLSIDMKFYDKYPQLKEKEFLTHVITDTVFSTMSLENQQVAKSRVNEIVLSILSEEESKGSHFCINQAS
jgi:hypothetical protein